MQITYKGDYSLKVILDLSEHYGKALVHIGDIAKRKDIPQNYLEQILIQLKQGGFVQSKKGPGGGYQLSRSPKDITLGEVVSFVEGSLYPISCLNPQGPRTCEEIHCCVFREVWQKVGNAVASIVHIVNFEDLMKRAAQLKTEKVLMYSI